MNILLAVDNSESSRNAVNELGHRAWPESSNIEVLHVVPPVHSWLDPVQREQLAEKAATVAKDAVDTLAPWGLRATAVIEEGDPRTEILERAHRMGASLIVLGAHGTTGPGFFTLGSVASTVARHAPCSVELIRPRKSPPGAPLRILLATDGSASSERAAKLIARRPWKPGTEVRIVSVVEFSTTPLLGLIEPPGVDFRINAELRAEAMKAAERAIEEATGTVSSAVPQVSSSISVLLDAPKRIILDEAEKFGADLIVVGSHGRRGLDRFLLGSVSEAIANHAPCSVAIAR